MAEIPARFSSEEGETLKGRVDDSREKEMLHLQLALISY